MERTSSIIPRKKANLSVYNIRKVYVASLQSFLKKHGDQMRLKKAVDGS